jgi:hypothetical protein
MTYDNTNRGKVWKAEQKRNPKEPDYKIELNFNGLDLVIPIWKRAPDANPKAPPWSFKIEQKDEQPAQQPISQQAQAKVYDKSRITSGKDLNDEVPFL